MKDIMKACQRKHGIRTKTIVIVVVCLFLCQSLSLDLFQERTQVSANTLAPELRLSRPEFKEEYLIGRTLLAHRAVNKFIGDYIRETLNLQTGQIGDLSLLPQYKAESVNIMPNGERRVIEIPVVGIPGLLKNTGQFGHVGLGKWNNIPVIYIDSAYFGVETDALKHDKKEVAKWEAKRLELAKELGRGISYQKYREVLNEIGIGKELHDEFHRSSVGLAALYAEAEAKALVDVDKVYDLYRDKKHGGIDRHDSDFNIAAMGLEEEGRNHHAYGDHPNWKQIGGLISDLKSSSYDDGYGEYFKVYVVIEKTGSERLKGQLMGSEVDGWYGHCPQNETVILFVDERLMDHPLFFLREAYQHLRSVAKRGGYSAETEKKIAKMEAQLGEIPDIHSILGAKSDIGGTERNYRKFYRDSWRKIIGKIGTGILNTTEYSITRCSNPYDLERLMESGLAKGEGASKDLWRNLGKTGLLAHQEVYFLEAEKFYNRKIIEAILITHTEEGNPSRNVAISMFDIEKGLRGQGLGTMFWDALMARLIKIKGWENLDINIGKRNPLLRFYEKMLKNIEHRQVAVDEHRVEIIVTRSALLKKIIKGSSGASGPESSLTTSIQTANSHPKPGGSPANSGPALFVDTREGKNNEVRELREGPGEEHDVLNKAFAGIVGNFSDLNDRVTKLNIYQTWRLCGDGNTRMWIAGKKGPPILVYIIDDEKLKAALPEKYRYLADGLITHAGTYRDADGRPRAYNLFIPRSIYKTLLRSATARDLEEWRDHEIRHLQKRDAYDKGMCVGEREAAIRILEAAKDKTVPIVTSLEGAKKEVLRRFHDHSKVTSKPFLINIFSTAGFPSLGVGKTYTAVALVKMFNENRIDVEWFDDDLGDEESNYDSNIRWALQDRKWQVVVASGVFPVDNTDLRIFMKTSVIMNVLFFIKRILIPYYRKPTSVSEVFGCLGASLANMLHFPLLAMTIPINKICEKRAIAETSPDIIIENTFKNWVLGSRDTDLSIKEDRAGPALFPAPVATTLKLPASESPAPSTQIDKSHPKKGGSPADYLVGVGENPQLQASHTIAGYKEVVKSPVSASTIRRDRQTLEKRGHLQKGEYKQRKGYEYSFTEEGKARFETINGIKQNAGNAVYGFVNSSFKLSDTLENGDKILFAIDEELGREGTERLVRQLVKDICRMKDSEAIEKKLRNIIFVKGRGKALADDVAQYTGDGKDGIKIKKENVIMITKAENETNCGTFKDAATITFVDDSKLDPMDYYPFMEVTLFTLVKALYRMGVTGYDRDRLVALYKSLTVEQVAEDQVIPLVIDSKVVKITLRHTAPLNYDELQHIYRAFHELLQAA